MKREHIYKLSERVLLDAYRLNMIGVKASTVWKLIFFQVVFSILLARLPSFEYDLQYLIKILTVFMSIFLISFIFPILGYMFYLPRYSKKIFHQQSDLQKTIVCSWNDEFLSTNTPDSYVKEAWSKFFQWDMNNKVMLFYYSEALFTLAPVSSYQPEQLTDIVQCLQKAGVPLRNRIRLSEPLIGSAQV